MNLPFTREQLYPSQAQAIRQEQFIEYLQEATRIVNTWPEWKRNIFGGSKPYKKAK